MWWLQDSPAHRYRGKEMMGLLYHQEYTNNQYHGRDIHHHRYHPTQMGIYLFSSSNLALLHKIRNVIRFWFCKWLWVVNFFFKSTFYCKKLTVFLLSRISNSAYGIRRWLFFCLTQTDDDALAGGTFMKAWWGHWVVVSMDPEASHHHHQWIYGFFWGPPDSTKYTWIWSPSTCVSTAYTWIRPSSICASRKLNVDDYGEIHCWWLGTNILCFFYI